MKSISASSEPALSATEVAAQIRAMSDADKIRFIKASNYFSFGGARSPIDLRQEAIRRALDGKRKCPIDVPLLTFLNGVMRSIAWSDRKSLNCGPKLTAVPNSGHAGQSASDFPDPRMNSEDRILEQDRLKEIRDAILDLFHDDATARLLADGMMDGLEGADLREVLELSELEFATKRRLVRRRIDKAFPKGWRS